MTAQEWYGFSCLILGALLMAGQVFVLLQTQQNVASATKAVHDAKEAAEQQAQHVRALRSAVSKLPPDPHDGQMRELMVSVEAEQERLNEATEKANATIDDWRNTLVSNLSSRIPLAVAGILLVILGAVVNGYIDLSAGNTGAA